MVEDYAMRLDTNGHSYIAKLTERDGICREVVFADGVQIHFAEFEASCLGSANRGNYLEAMTASIAAKHKREAAQN